MCQFIFKKNNNFYKLSRRHKNKIKKYNSASVMFFNKCHEIICISSTKFS